MNIDCNAHNRKEFKESGQSFEMESDLLLWCFLIYQSVKTQEKKGLLHFKKKPLSLSEDEEMDQRLAYSSLD